MRDKKSHHFKKHNTIWGPPKETLTVKNFDQVSRTKKQKTTYNKTKKVYKAERAL